ncbi:MAG: hypothetical protein ABI876_13175 [Bacteroidota bacterium]
MPRSSPRIPAGNVSMKISSGPTPVMISFSQMPAPSRSSPSSGGAMMISASPATAGIAANRDAVTIVARSPRRSVWRSARARVRCPSPPPMA